MGGNSRDNGVATPTPVATLTLWPLRRRLARILPISIHKVRIEHPHASWSFAFKCHCHLAWLGTCIGIGSGMGLDEPKISFAALPFPIRVAFLAMLACSRFLPLGLCFCLLYSCSLWLKNYALAMAMGIAKFRLQYESGKWRRSRGGNEKPADEQQSQRQTISQLVFSNTLPGKI